ncbi:MAG: flagellar type III secretion system pore protein FliP [bacterium]|jgi:flagellar biosynthetic protein FliP
MMRNTSTTPGRVAIVIALLAAVIAVSAPWARAAGGPSLSLEINGEESKISLPIKIIFFLTVLSLAPAVMVMVTSFTRIVVILSFLKHALGAHQMPPSQLLIGLALFLTYFTMMPVWSQINTEALQPLSNGEITEQEAMSLAGDPIRTFMFKHVGEKDLGVFIDMAGLARPENKEDVPTYVLIPAFITSELKTAFQIGFVLFLPFLVIDMAVASVLMSMGMMMVPPIMVSLPFKILLFVLVDGWRIVIESAVLGFR